MISIVCHNVPLVVLPSGCSGILGRRSLRGHLGSFYENTKNPSPTDCKLVNTLSQKSNGRWLSYLGGRWPIMSRRSLLFLVRMSLIFMRGRGLEVISSNVRNSSTVSPILFKLDLMTWIEGGVHVLVVRYCISLIIQVKGAYSHLIEKMVRNHPL